MMCPIASREVCHRSSKQRQQQKASAITFGAQRAANCSLLSRRLRDVDNLPSAEVQAV
jgi:hypothetical protein